MAICVTMVRRSWMTGGSVEATLELWASSLRSVKERIRPVFRQDRTAAAAGLFLDALLGPERRKTGWMRAEAAGDPGPWRQQALLDRSRWEADALRDLVRDYALETLAEPDAVLVIDETGFLKQGKASCGVARQYTGSAGKITNCQIGVFAVYVSGQGHALIDRALYLPKTWTDDPARRAAAHVPPGTVFATKPRLARAMIERAMAAGVPFGWVAGDTIYGVGEIEMELRRAGKGYVLGANATDVFNSWGKTPPVAGAAEAIAAGSRCVGLAAPVRGGRHERRAVIRLGLLRAGRPGRRRIQRGPLRPVDARASDPAQPRGWPARGLLNLVPSRNRDRKTGDG
jgi:SRSO17 transposase